MSFLSRIFGSKKKSDKPKGKQIGKVTHFYGHLGVAIVRFNQTVRAGANLHFYGTTTDFKDVAGSMQYNHEPIEEAKKSQEVGIKVKGKTREGDGVYLNES